MSPVEIDDEMVIEDDDISDDNDEEEQDDVCIITFNPLTTKLSVLPGMKRFIKLVTGQSTLCQLYVP